MIVRRLAFGFLVFFFTQGIQLSFVGVVFAEQDPKIDFNDPSMQKNIKQFALFEEGRKLERAGQYDLALQKYQAMTDPSVLNFDYDAGMGLGSMMEVYIKQGKYDKALEKIEWFMALNPTKYLDKKIEIEALIAARATKSPKPIENFIQSLRKKRKAVLPPKGVVAGYTDELAVIITRLYNHIGDHDSGIKFMDEFINYYSKIWKIKPEVLEGPGSKNQYFLIKKAFLQDKAEGFKGCIQAKPGEVCMGRATKALIDSDYFPW